MGKGRRAIRELEGLRRWGTVSTALLSSDRNEANEQHKSCTTPFPNACRVQSAPGDFWPQPLTDARAAGVVRLVDRLLEVGV